MEAVALVKRERIDFLLAVGGGSVVDGTKFVAAAACFEGRIPGRSWTRPPSRGVAAGLRADPAGHRLGEQPAAVVSRGRPSSPS
jgi:NADP-dependent alcohol dehydrogenase